MRRALVYFVATLFLLSCGNTGKQHQNGVAVGNETIEYSNEDFSIRYPKGWVVDASGWNGNDSLENEVYIYNPDGHAETDCYIRCVKAYLKIQWKTAAEAAGVSKMMKQMGTAPDCLGICYEKDSLEVGGHPAYLIVYLYQDGNDTIVNKQYVTLVKETHTTYYFNNNFSIKNWERGEMQGDKIISSVAF